MFPVFEVGAMGDITFSLASVPLELSDEFTCPIHKAIYRCQVFGIGFASYIGNLRLAACLR
jgi:hypothetical protein